MNILTIDPFFRRLFIVVSIVLGLYGIYLLLPVLIPFLTAFILAYFFYPLVKRLALFMPTWLAIIMVYTVITLTVVLVLAWLIPTLWDQLQSAWDYLPAAIAWYNDTARSWVSQYLQTSLPTINANDFSETFLGYVQNNYNVEDAQSFFTQILSSGMKVINNAGMVVLIPILMFYYLLGWDKRLVKWERTIPRSSRDKTLLIVKECDQVLMAFVKGQLLVMVLLGVLYAVLLQLVGLDLGLIIGMFAGLASFVPYLGFGLGIIAALVAGLFQFGLDWVHLGLIVGVYMAGQMVEGYVLQPLLLGDRIGLSPLWVMFAVFAGASLMGIIGMLIALPVSAIINVMFTHAYNAYLESDWYKGHKQLRFFD